MTSQKRIAKQAGFVYLIVVLAGIFNLAYVPSKLIVMDNAATTMNNIVSSETLFRLGILAGIVCYLAFLLLPFILYELLESINKKVAISMVVLAVISVPISLFNLTNKFAVLTLINVPHHLQTFQAAQLQAQIMLYLRYYNNGIQIASLFWGLWLLPFGYLVVKSRFLPKILGIFLMAGCFGYLLNFLGKFLIPYYQETGISGIVALPASIGEIGICLWLLIAGIKKETFPGTSTNLTNK